MKHEKGETVRFQNDSGEVVAVGSEYPVIYRPGEAIAIVLNRDWNIDEGLGEGGPWGWGGYTTEFILDLAETVNWRPDR